MSVSSLEDSFHAVAVASDGLLLHGGDVAVVDMHMVVDRSRSVVDVDSCHLRLPDQAHHLRKLLGEHGRLRIASVPLEMDLLMQWLLCCLLGLRHHAVCRVLQRLHRSRMLLISRHLVLLRSVGGTASGVLSAGLAGVQLAVLAHGALELLRHQRVVLASICCC